MKNRIFLLAFVAVALSVVYPPTIALATNHYIREEAKGSADGSDWINAWNDLPATLIRGDTYYIADGKYSGYTFDDAESGSTYITVKKATAADHGTETGWSSTYGDGQAALGSVMVFKEGYYIVDGNGTHTIPSDDTNDYGFKVSHDASDTISGIVRIGIANYPVSYVTMKYIHVYNTTNGDINNGTVGLRFYSLPYPSAQNYIKIQNCFLQNSGKDGIQISNSSFILIERCYIERYGKKLAGEIDYHGQTVQLFYGGSNIIFRYNIWEANEGQGLIQIAGVNNPTQNVRFYGNVVFVKYGEKDVTPGFNTSGGIIGDAWKNNISSGIYVYNNTIVNIGGDYGGVAHFPMRNDVNEHGWNNLFYNSGPTSGSFGWDNWGYNASGGGEIYGGIFEQTGLVSSIFTNYEGNIFTLTRATEGGKILISEKWWNSTDPFFGYLDSADDMFGNTRGADGIWDRGAYEFGVGTRPNPPANLNIY